MTGPSVDILLSTHDGRDFLDVQLRSLAAQTLEDWRLLVRDDGSTDGTVELLEDWAHRDPRVTVVSGSEARLGAAPSFLSLLGHSTAPYFAFCDQDDAWRPSKLATLVAAAGESAEPVAVFSDATLVDQTLNEIAPSYHAYQGVDVDRALQWPRLLAQNVVVGATLLGNAALRDELGVALPDASASVVMHDWWVTLVAAALGRVEYVPRSTILYRQHSGNVLGSKGSGLRRVVNNLRRGESIFKPIRYVRRVARQAACLDRWYGDRLSPQRRSVLHAVATLARGGRVRTRDLVRCLRKDVRMTSLDQDLVVALSVLLLGRFES